MKHIAVLTSSEIKSILETGKYLIRFYKKKPDFFNVLGIGDTIFFKEKKGEIIGQFEAESVFKIEGLERSDWKFLKETGVVQESDFNEKILLNKYAFLVKVSKVEQFITSPVEIEKGRKEWTIISEQ